MGLSLNAIAPFLSRKEPNREILPYLLTYFLDKNSNKLYDYVIGYDS